MEETLDSLVNAEAVAKRVVRMIISANEPPEFGTGNIPVKDAARIMGKSPQWIQAGIICGWLPIGYATLDGKLVKSLDEIKSNRGIDYTIIPKMFWQVTGYIWKEKNK